MFPEILRQHAETIPDKVAMRVKRGVYAQWTYAQAWSLTRSAAAFLQGRGVASGERVALFAGNAPEWVLAYLGIHLAGGTVVPLDAQFTDRELRAILAVAGCRLILCDHATEGAAGAVRSEGLIQDLALMDSGSPLFACSPLPDPAPRPPGSLMAVIFTSGTTGDPKGVCLTDSNIASNVRGILDLGLITPRDNGLCLLPLHHCYAMTAAVLTPLAAGASITFCLSLKGPDITAAMIETCVSVVPAVPRLIEGFERAVFEKVRSAPRLQQRMFRLLIALSHRIRTLTGWNPGRFFFPRVHRLLGPSFRFFVSGGAKLEAAVAERMLDLGIKVVEGYGLTETSPVVTFNPIAQPRPGSVGLPLPGVEVKISEPGPDGVGEVLVRGPNVMTGYDQRPEETAETIRQGWLHTGDLGWLDPDGYLRLTGRIKEVIVLPSGKNVYPEDVERRYSESPLVREICVLPAEERDGHIARLSAVVVPAFDELERRQIAAVHDAIRQELTHLSQSLPSHMRLTGLKLVTNDLPRTRLGKLRRAEIQRMAFDEIRASAPTPGPEDQALMAVPGAETLIARLAAMSGLERSILPSDHLELDLGLDSLARVELEVVLEREFGLKISPEEAPRITTVRDLLMRLSTPGSGSPEQAPWSRILRERISPPLAEVFRLQGRPMEKGFVECVRRTAGAAARLAFSLEVRGLERLPPAGPYLLCPTHASLLDAVLIFMALPRSHVQRLFFLGAREYFKSPFMRWVARVGRVISTGTADTLLVSLRRAAEALETGMSVCIFPEGAITRDGYLQRPRPGAGILACERRVPIVPVLMRGTYDTFSFRHPGLHFRPLGITIGDPIAPPLKPECGSADYAAMAGAWHRAILRLRAEDNASGSRTSGRSPLIPEEAAPPFSAATGDATSGPEIP